MIKILWFSMWLIAGFLTVAAIMKRREKRKIEKALVEQLLFHEALSEKSHSDVEMLCHTLGTIGAYNKIITDYKTKHEIHD